MNINAVRISHCKHINETNECMKEACPFIDSIPCSLTYLIYQITLFPPLTLQYLTNGKLFSFLLILVTYNFICNFHCALYRLRHQQLKCL